MPRSRRPNRVYRALLRLLPFEFRADFGEEMAGVFHEQRQDARSRRLAHVRLWIVTVAGFLRTAPREHFDLLAQDTRYALVTMKRSPSFTAVAVLSLAIGIGANTTIFTVLDALLLRPPAVADPDRLVDIYRTMDGRIVSGEVSYPEYLDIRDTAPLADVAAHQWVWGWLRTGGEPVETTCGLATPNLFTVFGIAPRLGRFFTADEDRAAGQHPVAVLSLNTWRTRFGSDPAIVGRPILVNGVALTVIGVAPAALPGIYAGRPVHLWVPLSMASALGASFDRSARSDQALHLVGRVAPMRSMAEVAVALETLAHRQARDFPSREGRPGLTVSPLRGVAPAGRAELARAPLVILGILGVVLLIASFNLAGVLLARGVARQRELAIRVSLGARRARLIRQLLTETLLLASLGGAAGLLLATWAHRWVVAYYAYSAPGIELQVDMRVLAGTALLSILTGLLVGVAPALEGSRQGTISLTTRSNFGAQAMRLPSLRTALVVGQVALSVALLVAAVLLVKSLSAIVLSPGYEQNQFAHFRLRPSRIGYRPDQAERYYRELTRRLSAMPGVEAVVHASVPPSARWGAQLDVQGTTLDGATRVLNADYNDVVPGFLPALGIHVLQGRDFDEGDRQARLPVAIVNQALADRLWPAANPLGRTLMVRQAPAEVIGVVGNIHAARSGEAPRPFVYLAYWQRALVDARVLVRVAGDPRANMPALRRAIVELDPDVHIGQEMTLAERTDQTFEAERLLAATVLSSGAAALCLSALGIYGVLAFAVRQRCKEFAIRLAIGSTRGSLQSLVLRQMLWLTVPGVLLGIGLSLVSGRLLAGFLYGVDPANLPAFVLAAALTIAMTLISSIVPTMRAARVDPVVELRS